MPLHIAIDARRIRDFGIGTYIRSLVHALAAIDVALRCKEQRRKAGGHLVGGRCQQRSGGLGGRRIRRADRRP